MRYISSVFLCSGSPVPKSNSLDLCFNKMLIRWRTTNATASKSWRSSAAAQASATRGNFEDLILYLCPAVCFETTMHRKHLPSKALVDVKMFHTYTGIHKIAAQFWQMNTGACSRYHMFCRQPTQLLPALRAGCSKP